MQAGEYVVHPEVGEKEMSIFNKTLEGHMGLELKPVAVASQVVAGINYLFLCTGAPIAANPVTQLYSVEIFVKLPGDSGAAVELMAINEIDVADLKSARKENVK